MVALHMIGNGSPSLVGLCTHGAVVYMDYMYAHMIGKWIWFYHLSDNVYKGSGLGQSGGANRWRVCYQWEGKVLYCILWCYLSHNVYKGNFTYHMPPFTYANSNSHRLQVTPQLCTVCWFARIPPPQKKSYDIIRSLLSNQKFHKQTF